MYELRTYGRTDGFKTHFIVRLTPMSRLNKPTQRDVSILEGYTFKQGVALTGRNTTGPPSRAVPGEVLRSAVVLWTTTDDDDRRQTTIDVSDPTVTSLPLHYV